MSAQSIPSELILHILKFLTQPADLLSSALCCKSWSSHALEILWYKPNIVRPSAWLNFCNILHQTRPTTFPYTQFIRRINLSLLASDVDDRHLACLQVCERLERITLANCSKLTDEGLLAFLGNKERKTLVSIDLSDCTQVTDKTIAHIAHICPNLQGLNLSMCKETEQNFVGVTDDSIVMLAERCPGLRRIKLNNCVKITDQSAFALARHCPALLEIDFMNTQITNSALLAVFSSNGELREFRVNHCNVINDEAFTMSVLAKRPMIDNIPYYDQLRLLDLTAVQSITDASIRIIVNAAPKIRNLVLNKCPNISDESVFTICLLGRYLHYLHLGHCFRLTDESIIQLARHCTRIRYIDLACCSQLTDRAVIELATLPKLKRIGLVKCTNITDQSIYALTSHPRIAHSLERVHLSYCDRLTVPAIIQLVNFCEKLTHLSLTQVRAFLRPDFQQFRRTPPKDFTQQQRDVFCVFSGRGVRDLRNYFNTWTAAMGSSNVFHGNQHQPVTHFGMMEGVTPANVPDSEPNQEEHLDGEDIELTM